MQFSLAHLRSPYSLPYRWILPVLQLLLCLVALWPVRGRINQAFFHDQPQRVVVLSGNTSVEDIEAESSNASDDEKTHLRVPMALDLPALLVQTPYVLLYLRPHCAPSRQHSFARMECRFPALSLAWSSGGRLDAASKHCLPPRRKPLLPRITRLETIGGAGHALHRGCAWSSSTFSGAIEENSFLSGIRRLRPLGRAQRASAACKICAAKTREVNPRRAVYQQPNVQPRNHHRHHPTHELQPSPHSRTRPSFHGRW